jgi:hypothetical protein
MNELRMENGLERCVWKGDELTLAPLENDEQLGDDGGEE